MPTDRSASRSEQAPSGPSPLAGLALLVAFVCGAVVALQSRVNGTLTETTGALVAAWFSFGSGFLVLTLLLASPTYRSHLGRVLRALRDRRLAPWQLIGGAFGGLLVATQAYAVPHIGVALFVVALVGGQLGSALLVDRAGLGPGGKLPITLGRAIAALIAVSGVVVAVGGRVGGNGLDLLPVVLAFAVGMGASVQQALNGRVTQVTRDGLATAWVNFLLGCTVLLLIGAWPVFTSPAPWSSGAPVAPWWAWLGGLCGVAFITGLAWAAQHAGILELGLAMIAGQVVLGLAIDALTPQTRDQIDVLSFVGSGLTLVAAGAAALAVRRARRAQRAQRSLSPERGED